MFLGVNLLSKPFRLPLLFYLSSYKDIRHWEQNSGPAVAKKFLNKKFSTAGLNEDKYIKCLLIITSADPKINNKKIEVNKIMNPAFLLGTAFNIAYWHRKYHSGTICKGVSNPQTSNALSGCEKEEIPK